MSRSEFNERYSALLEILDSAPVAVAITSDGSIRYANRCVSELLGVTVGDRAPDWYVNPGDRDRLLETLQRDGAVRGAEIQLYGADREIRDVLATFAITQYEGRESILGWLVDFTERKKVEEALRENRHFLETILEHSPAVIYSKRKDGRYVYINREWENTCNLKRETVLGRTDFELFPEDEAQQFRTNDVNAMGAGRMTESQERLDTPLGEQVFLSRKVPLTSSSDEVEGICGISTNITDRRRAELALQEANTMLQQRTNELAKSLEDLHAAQDRLVQTEKFAALGRLVAGVAHEINTPLGNSLTVASTFLNKTNQFEADAASGNVRRSTLNEYLSTSREAASQIMGNLNQAVDLIQSFKQLDADSNFSDRRGFDLGQMTEQIVRSLRSGLRSHDLTFSVDCEPNLVMNSYPGPYGQVLTNLVLNSAAHAFPGHSRGSVRITTREFDKDNVEISVSDDGCGMTPEIQRQAFDPFFTTRRDQGKVGLGLHIVYNIVTNRLGGRIDLDTRPGEGTRILMIVPREAPSEIAAE